MDSVKGTTAYNMQTSSPNPTETVKTSAAHSSGHARALTPAMLSHHAFNALNAKEAWGNEQEKMLAKFAKEAISSGQLQISPNQPPNGVAQFGGHRNQDVLVIQAKLNERAEYDILGVGLRRRSEEPISMKLPSPASRSTPSLESMPQEIIHMILDNFPNGEPKNRMNSLALSSKGLYALAMEKTQKKAECSALLDRLGAIKDIPADQGPDGWGGARLFEFKAILGSLDNFLGKEKMDLIRGLADNISNLNFKSPNGFRLMLDLTESIRLSENSKSVDAEHKTEQVRDRNKTIATLVSKLAIVGEIGGTVDHRLRPEAFEKLCSALEGLEGKNGANYTASALPKLAAWYTWHHGALGPERFGRLVNLADRNKLDVSDRAKSEMVKSLTSRLAQHDKPEDIANHFNVLCRVSKAIVNDEIKADAMTYLTKRLNWIGDEDLREISKGHIDEAVDTINTPELKARVAAVTPIRQDD